MAKRARTTKRAVQDAGAASAASQSQADFLVMSIMAAVVPMIEGKCGEMNKRDRGTLQRHIEKAVRSFVAGAQR